MEGKEFFGNLQLVPVKNPITFQDECVDWMVVDSTRTLDRSREIEDGDFLQVFDSSGKMLLNKVITRDYKSHYNLRHKRQLYNGMPVKWLAAGIDAGYWVKLFVNRHRARIVKKSIE